MKMIMMTSLFIHIQLMALGYGRLMDYPDLTVHIRFLL